MCTHRDASDGQLFFRRLSSLWGKARIVVVRSDPCEISRSVHLGPWVGFNILPVELIILFVLLCNPGVITGGLAPLTVSARERGLQPLSLEHSSNCRVINPRTTRESVGKCPLLCREHLKYFEPRSVEANQCRVMNPRVAEHAFFLLGC